MSPSHPHRRRALDVGWIAALVLAGLSGAPASARDERAARLYDDVATHCRVVDGDTLHCDGGRIRLLGIDAPELPGHCGEGRGCAPGDPFSSTSSLQAAIGDGAVLRIRRIGTDRYGRLLAMVFGQGGDLSCWQLAHRQAIYRPRWGNGGAVAATCPGQAR